MKLSCRAVTSYKLQVTRCRKTCGLLRVSCHSSGQSMIEVVVGIGVATLLSVALISTSIYTQKLSRSAKNNTQATKLAQESIEKVRIFRDRKLNGFTSLPASGCATLDSTNADPGLWSLSTITCPSLPLASGTTPPGVQTVVLDQVTFIRWLQFANPTPSKKTVVVNVAWQEATSWQLVTNTTFLSNTCTGQIGPGVPANCP